MEKVGAIILAAGKGTRMNVANINKVTFPLADKPMILRTVDIIEKASIDTAVIVVGHAKESVMNVLGEKVLFAEQKEQLGTAHALSCGLKKMPEEKQTVLVMNGDDSAFYTTDILTSLIAMHTSSQADITFLTITVSNPVGLGRVVRNAKGDAIKIVEDKDAHADEKKIQEINPGCYVFDRSFLKISLPKVKKSRVTGEYYLTSLIDIAIASGEKVMTLEAGNIPWKGINTPEELEQANFLYKQNQHI